MPAEATGIVSIINEVGVVTANVNTTGTLNVVS